MKEGVLRSNESQEVDPRFVDRYGEADLYAWASNRLLSGQHFDTSDLGNLRASVLAAVDVLLKQATEHIAQSNALAHSDKSRVG